MPPEKMPRCFDCDKTIKQSDLYHLVYVHEEIENMEMFPHYTNKVRKSPMNSPQFCCDCMGHDLGECIKERARQKYYEEFKQAIVRSSGGISRAGFLGGI
tara:strand:- start:12794 stop:13093 length:300 start_codon:yes stop_codon:yes gene_type:complete